MAACTSNAGLAIILFLVSTAVGGANAFAQDGWQWRTQFAYTLKNHSSANVALAVSLLNSLLTATNLTVSSSFGPDLGLATIIGLSTPNADFGGRIDFSSLKDLTTFYKAAATSPAYNQLSSLTSTTPGQAQIISAKYFNTQPYVNSSNAAYPVGTYIRTAFLLYFNAAAAASTRGQVVGQLVDALQNSPVAPVSFTVDADLNLAQTLYPTLFKANADVAGSAVFSSQAQVQSFYSYFLTSPQWLAIVASVPKLTVTSVQYTFVVKSLV